MFYLYKAFFTFSENSSHISLGDYNLLIISVILEILPIFFNMLIISLILTVSLCLIIKNSFLFLSSLRVFALSIIYLNRFRSNIKDPRSLCHNLCMFIKYHNITLKTLFATQILLFLYLLFYSYDISTCDKPLVTHKPSSKESIVETVAILPPDILIEDSKVYAILGITTVLIVVGICIYCYWNPSFEVVPTVVEHTFMEMPTLYETLQVNLFSNIPDLDKADWLTTLLLETAPETLAFADYLLIYYWANTAKVFGTKDPVLLEILDNLIEYIFAFLRS